MDKFEASGETREKQNNELTEARKRLISLEKPFGFADVVKTVLWTLLVLVAFHILLVKVLMDDESKQQLGGTPYFDAAMVLPSLLVGTMLHFWWKREERKRLRDKIKSLTVDDELLLKQEECREASPKANQAGQPKRKISKPRIVWGLLQLIGALMLLGLLILLLIGMVVAITDLFAPDLYKNIAFFKNDTVQFFLSLFQVVGFIGGLFLVIFTTVIGSHAAGSKEPIEKNLNPEKLKSRFKNAIIAIILIFVAQHYANKIRDWWWKGKKD